MPRGRQKWRTRSPQRKHRCRAMGTRCLVGDKKWGTQIPQHKHCCQAMGAHCHVGDKNGGVKVRNISIATRQKGKRQKQYCLLGKGGHVMGDKKWGTQSLQCKHRHRAMGARCHVGDKKRGTNSPQHMHCHWAMGDTSWVTKMEDSKSTT